MKRKHKSGSTAWWDEVILEQVYLLMDDQGDHADLATVVRSVQLCFHKIAKMFGLSEGGALVNSVERLDKKEE
jgi:hypothetical protein